MSRTAQPGTVPAVDAVGLGKRYGQTWGLQDCNVQVPKGAISALLGPNGSGKTTLLRMVAGFATASAGSVRVLGRAPAQNEEFLGSVGYLAQEMPLYRRLNVAEHLEFGRRLNRHWDESTARDRLTALRVPFDRPVATLSGGQHAQVALALPLPRRPTSCSWTSPWPPWTLWPGQSSWPRWPPPPPGPASQSCSRRTC
jgi:ABC-2 type transport system ATP-binding protein